MGLYLKLLCILDVVVDLTKVFLAPLKLDLFYIQNST